MKNSVDDLAVFGGNAEFPQPLHVGRPNLGDFDRFVERLRGVFDRAWLTNDGPLVREFEQTIAHRHQVKHCIATSNGTSALEIVFKALGLSGEVILPAFTFVATAHALEWQGLKPVFCDVEPNTFHIDAGRIEELITEQTSAIIGVHVWGQPCAIDQIESVARQHSLKAVFDAAHAYACTYQGAPIGRFGNAEVISFHGTKFVNSLEGGCILTNDDELAEQARLMRNFGFFGNDNVLALGTNAKMNEACAAMGLTSLDSADQFIEHNHQVHRAYRDGLAELDGLDVISFESNNNPQARSENSAESRNYQYVVTRVGDLFSVTRDDLLRVLEAEGILARRYFYPGCHRMEPYRTQLGPDIGDRLAETEKACAEVLLLPTGTQLAVSDVERVSAIIQFVAQHGEEVSARLNVAADSCTQADSEDIDSSGDSEAV